MIQLLTTHVNTHQLYLSTGFLTYRCHYPWTTQGINQKLFINQFFHERTQQNFFTNKRCNIRYFRSNLDETFSGERITPTRATPRAEMGNGKRQPVPPDFVSRPIFCTGPCSPTLFCQSRTQNCLLKWPLAQQHTTKSPLLPLSCPQAHKFVAQTIVAHNKFAQKHGCTKKLCALAAVLWWLSPHVLLVGRFDKLLRDSSLGSIVFYQHHAHDILLQGR